MNLCSTAWSKVICNPFIVSKIKESLVNDCQKDEKYCYLPPTTVHTLLVEGCVEFNFRSEECLSIESRGATSLQEIF